tara:strand:- start:62 stop:985 length:924 start_codon:yes stop_codon:yes gene_type:complete
MSLKKAQKVRSPWAVARAIVDQKDGEVNPLWSEQVAATGGDEDKKRKLMGKIVAGIEENPYNKSMDNVDAFDELMLKGTVNGKKFSYDNKGHQEAIDYATDLMDNKENVDFEWHDEEKKAIQKIGSAAMGALAGWWLGGEIQDINRQTGSPTPAQQREFERQIQQAMRSKGKKITKENAMEKMQTFFQTDTNDTYVRKTPVANAVQADEESALVKKLSFPPFAGAEFDPSSHRWVKPENYARTYHARGGKKRVRGTGTGVGERSVSGHGKGRIRGEGQGRKFKGDTDLAATRRKEGFTHGKGKKSIG